MDPELWRKIEEIFHQALELPVAERAAFLAASCGENSELKAEVESLLDRESEETILKDVVAGAALSFSEGNASHVDRRIGPYRITGLIGRGGMAEVYRAVRDDDQYQKQVAIKLIRGGLVSEYMVQRFRYERQILATLEHPNIAHLLEGGTSQEGLPYFVMEFVDGEPIVSYCQSRRLSTRERLLLFLSVCDAIQYAHRNLVIHRDLKPSNILVTREGVPKLLDFGIAKLLSPDPADDAPPSLTITAGRFMTPDYASPEQVRGENVTTATDVYSLGAVLYELLSGARAHVFQTRNFAEYERVICREEPRKPSTAAQSLPVRQKRLLSGDLDTIVLTAMRKEPDRRYHSAEQLGEEIGRFLAGRPIVARQDSLWYRAGKFGRRHRLSVGFAALLLLLLVAFAIVMTYQATQIARQRDRANRTARFLIELFEVSDPGRSRGETVTARELLDHGAEKISTELREEPETRAAILNTMGEVYQKLGLYERSLELLEEALNEQRASLPKEHPDLAATLSKYSETLRLLDRYQAAERAAREALQIRKKAFRNDHAQIAESLNALGLLRKVQGDYQSAEELYREALEMRRRVLGDKSPEVATTLNNLARLLSDEGRPQEAEPLLREAFEIDSIQLGLNHPDLAITISTLALVMREQKKYAEAEKLYRRALKIRVKALGKEHPFVATNVFSLGLVILEKGDAAGSEILLREALDTWTRTLPPGHINLSYAQIGVGRALLAQNNAGAAEPFLRNALEIRSAILAPDHPNMAPPLFALGRCLFAQGRFEESEGLLLKSYEIRQNKLGSDHPETQESRQQIVDLYKRWNKPQLAAAYN